MRTINIDSLVSEDLCEVNTEENIMEPAISTMPHGHGNQEVPGENRAVMQEAKSETCCPPRCYYLMSQIINGFSAILGLGMLLYYGNDMLIEHVDRDSSNYLGIIAGSLHLFLGSTNAYNLEQIKKNQVLIPVRRVKDEKVEIKISSNGSALHNQQGLKGGEDRSSSFSISNFMT
jgi:hypothetical protein